jgi:hypothetical protein
MYRYLVFMLISFGVSSHQFTPTYPELSQSYMPKVLKLEMQLLNKRQDISYYELEVLDIDSNPVSFAARQKIVEVQYLKRKDIEVYIRQADKDKAYYVCSKSKILKGQNKTSPVSSKICSKIIK